MVKINNPPTVHDQSHAHDGADGSGTVGHGDVTGVSANQHHTPTALSDTVPGTSLVGTLGTSGAGATVSRDDHAHTLVAPGNPVSQDFGDVAAAGVATNAARDDHLHGMMAAPVVPLWVQPFSVEGAGTTLHSQENDYGTALFVDSVVTQIAHFTVPIPSNFIALVKAVVVVISLDTANLVFDATPNFASDGELNTLHNDGVGSAIQGMVANTMKALDVSAALTDIAAGDYVGMEFLRFAGDVSDTIEDMQILGLLLEYST